MRASVRMYVCVWGGVSARKFVRMCGHSSVAEN